jgi:Ti-type conjugative transfer relaxase TraA
MIIKGKERSDAKQLAYYLLNTQSNEHVEVHEVSGFMSDDLVDAFIEMDAIAKGTRCMKHVFSTSINPPVGKDVSIADYEDAIAKTEEKLGLTGQPRAIVFHENGGRRHAHVVWSRISVDTHKAINLPFYKRKLTEVTRQLFLQHGWDMPKGLENPDLANSHSLSHQEWQQAKRMMDDPILLKKIFVEAWEASDSKAAFQQALAEHGLFLARGDRRGFVAVDINGTPYSLSRWTGVKPKNLKAKLGDPKELPSIEEVKKHIAEKLPQHVRDAVQQQKEQMALHVQKRKRTQAELIDIITYQHAAFNRRMMERSLYRYFDNAGEMRQVIADLVMSGKLIALGEQNGQAFYTTKDMQALEQKLVDMADGMATKHSHKIKQECRQQAITAFNQKLSKETNGKAQLTDNQLKAIDHLTHNTQLSSLVGVAGAGKTTIMQVVKDAYERDGYRVRGAALSGIAAGGLKESGIKSGTLHALEMQIQAAENINRQQSWDSLSQKQQDFINRTLLTKHDVIIIDEAGMVGTRQLASIVERASKAGAKVILCGDHEQLQSIEAGAAFRTVIERTGYADISEVRRQKEEWMRKATIQFAKGDTAGALRQYHAQGHVQHIKTKEDAVENLVSDYMASVQQNPEHSRMVLAYTRKDVAALNKAIKSEMIKAGKVGEKSTELKITTYKDDQEISEIQGFAIGDRVMFRENNTQMGVMNGTLATITKINGHIVDARLDNGHDLRFNAKEYTRFQLGYAATVHKSQGVTVDQSFVLASKHFDRHTSYVAMTRHKENVSLYASKDTFKTSTHLMNSLSKEGRKLSSLDFTENRPVQTKMGYRKEQLLHRTKSLTNHHRKQREVLSEKQKQRRMQEQQLRRDRLPKGLRGIWSRITGGDEKLRNEIRDEIRNSKDRDAAEKHALIKQQLKERKVLQQDITAFRHEVRTQLLHLRQNASNALKSSKIPRKLDMECHIQHTQKHSMRPGFQLLC